VDDLVAFLRARLVEDEQAAQATEERAGYQWTAGTGMQSARIKGPGMTIYDEGGHGEKEAAHIVRWDPARVLAEVEAKRRILDEFKPRVDQMDATIEGEWGMGNYPSGESDLLVKLLALPYTGHPGYREEWRPL
jgi:hypothetical protein